MTDCGAGRTFAVTCGTVAWLRGAIYPLYRREVRSARSLSQRPRRSPDIQIKSFPAESARWNEEMDERSARRNHENGCHDGPWRSFALVSLGRARIPMMARSKHAPL